MPYRFQRRRDFQLVVTFCFSAPSEHWRNERERNRVSPCFTHFAPFLLHASWPVKDGNKLHPTLVKLFNKAVPAKNMAVLMGDLRKVKPLCYQSTIPVRRCEPQTKSMTVRRSHYDRFSTERLEAVGKLTNDLWTAKRELLASEKVNSCERTIFFVGRV